MMRRAALAMMLGFVVVILAGVVGPAAGQDKDKKEVKVEGKLVCTKCTLEENKACGHAVKVKEGDKTVIYYLKDKGGKEAYHKEVCPAGNELAVVVTGKLVEKDKKHIIEDAKVEVKK